MSTNDITDNDQLINEDYGRKVKANVGGLIKGKGDGNWGRITVRRDGSILLENVALSNINIRNCDLTAESGENPNPFADRMNQLQDFASFGAQDKYPLYAGHTHSFDYEGTDKCICGGEKHPIADLVPEF